MKLRQCLIALVFGLSLAGCESSASTTGATISLDPEIVDLYHKYVEEGGTLSYENWIISIKGEKGDQGDTGPQGPKGDDGYTPYIGDNGNWWINNEDTG